MTNMQDIMAVFADAQKAVEERPELLDKIESLELLSEVRGGLICRREEAIHSLKTQLAEAQAQIARLEVERDDAIFHQLESDDKATHALRLVESIQRMAVDYIKAVEPVVEEPTEFAQPIQEAEEVQEGSPFLSGSTVAPDESLSVVQQPTTSVNTSTEVHEASPFVSMAAESVTAPTLNAPEDESAGTPIKEGTIEVQKAVYVELPTSPGFFSLGELTVSGQTPNTPLLNVETGNAESEEFVALGQSESNPVKEKVWILSGRHFYDKPHYLTWRQWVDMGGETPWWEYNLDSCD